MPAKPQSPQEEWRDFQRRAVSITRETSYHIWNSVIVLDGVFLSVCATMSILEKSVSAISFVVAAASLVSALLVIWNFYSIREAYTMLGQCYPPEEGKKTREEKNKDLNKAYRRKFWNDFREHTAVILLAIQFLLIGFLAVWNNNGYEQDVSRNSEPLRSQNPSN